MTTDINIINVNGLDYPIKDQIARDVAESAVKIFAYYEDGLVASQAYATIGTPICWKGELYYTIATVARGNIWAVGVNLRVGEKAGIVIERVNTIENELTANGNRIYMDYKDGKYGYNIDPQRGADTFFPFKASEPFTWSVSCRATNHYDDDASGDNDTSVSFTLQINGITVGTGSASNTTHSVYGNASVSKSGTYIIPDG